MAFFDQFFPPKEEETEAPTLKDFTVEKERANYVNEPTVESLSGKLDLLAENDPVTQSHIKDEIRTGELGLTKDVVEKSRALNKARTKEYLTSQLANPQVAPDRRMQMALEWADDVERRLDADELLYNKALTETVEREGEADSPVVWDMANAYKEARATRAIEKKAIEGTALINNTSASESILNLLEVMVPFAEQNIIDNITQSLMSEEAEIRAEGFVLLGNFKSQLRDWYQAMPPEARREAMPHIIAITQMESSNVMSENELIAQDTLQTILDGGYYGDGSELFDNVMSVIDTALLGLSKPATVPLRLAARGVRKSLSKGYNKVNKAMPTRTPEPEDVPPSTKPEFKEGLEATDVEVPTTPTQMARNDRAVKDDAIGAPNPEVAAQTAKDVAPNSVVKLAEKAIEDPSGALAKSFFGRKREDIVAWLWGPKIGSEANVISRLPQPDVELDELNAAISLAGARGNRIDGTARAQRDGIEFTKEERASGRKAVEDDMLNPQPVNKSAKWIADPAKRKVPSANIKPRLNEATLKPVHDKLGDGGRITVNYGPATKKGSFRSAKEALEAVVPALRHRGVTKDEVTVLKIDETGRNWRPVNPEDPNDVVGGEFVAQVSHRYVNNSDTVTNFSTDGKLSVLNYLDRFNIRMGVLGENSGTLTSTLFDPASILPPQMFLSAGVKVDRAARLTKEFGAKVEGVMNRYKSMSKDDQQFMDDLWKRANLEGLDINRRNGHAVYDMSDEMIELNEDFKAINDKRYDLTNELFSNHLRQDGYSIVQHGDGELFLFGKTKATPNKGTVEVYDPKTDSVRSMSGEEQARLYDAGGVIVEVDEGVKIANGTETRKIVVLNDKETYNRALNSGDRVLNYRKGQYSIFYEDPIFIKWQKANHTTGRDKEIAVATARNTSEAQKMLDKLNDTELNEDAADGRVYKMFHDNKRNPDTSTADLWSTFVQQGNTPQRVRGETLKAVEDGNLGSPRILSPSESIERSIHDIAQRSAMAPWSEANKARFMAKYEGQGVLPTTNGKERWPQGPHEIGGSSRKAGDARTEFEYINVMERGWSNSVDDATRYGMKKMAEMFAGRHVKWSDMAEGFLLNRVRGAGVTSVFKKKVFQAYLAMNPIRQAIVQSHQAVQIIGLNPKYALGPLQKDMTVLHLAKNDGKGLDALVKNFGIDRAEALKMRKQWEDTGLPDAVDQNNLIAKQWDHAVSGDWVNKLGRGVDRVVQPFQSIGFDVGERANLASAWLLFRKRAMDRGEDMNDVNVQAQVQAEARNFTYNMNRAGDMPYNQNALGVAFQFLQVPHKAATQVFLNKQLTGKEKGQMFVWNAVAYGLPLTWLTNEFIPDLGFTDPGTTEMVKRGMESTMLNWLATMATNEEQDIDYSNLSPWGVDGIHDIVDRMWEDGIGQSLYHTPAGQVLLNRAPSVIKAAANLVNPVDEFTFAERGMELADSFIRLTSGPGNLYKSLRAVYLDELGKKTTSSGDAQFDVTNLEKLSQIAGFRSWKEAQTVARSIALSEDLGKYDDMAKQVIKDYIKRLNTLGQPVVKGVEAMDVYREVWRVLPNTPRVNKIVQQHLSRWVRDPQANNLSRMMKGFAEGALTPTETKEHILNNPNLSDERKAELIRTIENSFRSSGKE